MSRITIGFGILDNTNIAHPSKITGREPKNITHKLSNQYKKYNTHSTTYTKHTLCYN
jgi:hypothetical protein